MHGNLEAVNGGASLAAGVGSAFQSPLEIFEKEAGCRVGQRFFWGGCFCRSREKGKREKGFAGERERRTRKKNRAESFSEREDSREH